MKNIFLTLFLCFSFVFGADVIDGFRGLKWGDSLESIGEYKLVEEEPLNKVIHVSKINDKLSIGASKLTIIIYSFFDNKLYLVTSAFEGLSAFNEIKDVFEAKYGKMSKINKSNDYALSLLDKDDNYIAISYDKRLKNGFFIMQSKKITELAVEYYEKESAKKAANDL